MCEDTAISKTAEEGVWMQGSGIVIPCTYMCVLCGKKIDREHVRSELKKKLQEKESICLSRETGTKPVRKP